MKKCWAYTEDGRICGAPAIDVDPVSGIAVCRDHSLIRRSMEDYEEKFHQEVESLLTVSRQRGDTAAIQQAADEIVKLRGLITEIYKELVVLQPLLYKLRKRHQDSVNENARLRKELETLEYQWSEAVNVAIPELERKVRELEERNRDLERKEQ